MTCKTLTVYLNKNYESCQVYTQSTYAKTQLTVCRLVSYQDMCVCVYSYVYTYEKLIEHNYSSMFSVKGLIRKLQRDPDIEESVPSPEPH